MNRSDPEARYTQRIASYTAEENRLARRSRAVSNVRLAVFLLGTGCVLATLFNAEASDAPLFWATLVALFAFVVLVSLHDRVIRRQRRAEGFVRLNREGLARRERRWDEIPQPTAPEELTRLPESRDLNLFGRASLFHLMGTIATPPGRETLADWLVHPAPTGEVRERQDAVRELAEPTDAALDLRQDLQLEAREMAELGRAGPFLEWAESEPWLLARPALVWSARALTALSFVMLVAVVLGLIPWSLWALVGVFNLGLTSYYKDELHGILDRLEAREVGFGHYKRLFARIDTAPWNTGLLARLLRATRTDPTDDGNRGEHGAHHAMEKLSRWVVLADTRHSGLVHFALTALGLWDFHVLHGIERWQRKHGRHARPWLEALGEIEALSALATLRFEEPEWVFPECTEAFAGADESPAKIEAQGLGHPLLPPEARVDNDVELGPPGTFLLVTGSNMSGKSTLLRALGTNVTLAQAGGPVCAEALRLPPVELGTSLLIEDSLTSGVSFFLAELQRLKAIVDRADSLAHQTEQAHPSSGRTLLFLLDEVLRGTNSAERRIAIERVLGHLLEAGSIGAITTHDLALAEAEGIREAAQPVHFRETLHDDRGVGEGPPMTFDYRLREGLATTTNALALLRLVGLDDALRGDEPGTGESV